MNDDRDVLAEELLSAYADGGCDADERAAVEARLAREPEWRAVLDDVRWARDALRALPPREPPPGFVESLVAGSGRLRAGRNRPLARAGVGVAAAVAAAVVAFVLAPSDGDGRPAPDPAATRVRPPLAMLAEVHGATDALVAEPLGTLAPAVVTAEVAP